MHLKVFGAMTLLLQQVTINGWKRLPGPCFWNPSQKKNLSKIERIYQESLKVFAVSIKKTIELIQKLSNPYSDAHVIVSNSIHRVPAFQTRSNYQKKKIKISKKLSTLMRESKTIKIRIQQKLHHTLKVCYCCRIYNCFLFAVTTICTNVFVECKW